YKAGISLRRLRSPEAPKITNAKGSFTSSDMSDALPRAGLPVVCGFRCNFPWRQRHQQILGKGMNVWLVHVAQLIKLFRRCLAIPKKNATRSQVSTHSGEFIGRQAIAGWIPRLRVENVREIDNRMTRDRECELSLVRRRAVDTNHHERCR